MCRFAFPLAWGCFGSKAKIENRIAEQNILFIFEPFLDLVFSVSENHPICLQTFLTCWPKLSLAVFVQFQTVVVGMPPAWKGQIKQDFDGS